MAPPSRPGTPRKRDRVKKWLKNHFTRSATPSPTLSPTNSQSNFAKSRTDDGITRQTASKPREGDASTEIELPESNPDSEVQLPQKNPSTEIEHREGDLSTREDLPSAARILYEGVKATLRTIEKVSDVFPPLKSTAAALAVICDTIDRYRENPKEFEKLLQRVELVANAMKSCPPRLSLSLETRFERLAGDLNGIKVKVEAKLAKDRWRLERVMLSEQDKQDISDITEQVTRIVQEAMFEVTLKNGSWTLQIIGEIDWMKGQLITIEDKIDANTGTMEHIRNSIELQRLLEKLGDVKGAEFSNRAQGAGCIPGSRLALLDLLLGWARDPTSSHLFWLSGLAGTGKTAVSKTLCSYLSDLGLLGASFFCTLKAADRRDVSLIIPTLARILAETHPGFCRALQAVLEKGGRSCKNPTEMDLSAQYAKLILEPAKEAFTKGECVVFCVDALDECSSHDTIKEFISAILSQAPTSPIKFFLTSRPEHAVRQSFESSTGHGSLRLHEIEKDIVRADVYHYLETQFKSVKILRDHYRTTTGN